MSLRLKRLCLTAVLFMSAVSTLVAAPPHDNFSSPRTISGSLPVSNVSSNWSATLESGEYNWPKYNGANWLYNNYNNRLGGGSVWYRWTAPSTGFYHLRTAGSSLNDPKTAHLLMCVYNGTTTSSLTLQKYNTRGAGLQAVVSNIYARSGETLTFAVYSMTDTNYSNPLKPHSTQSSNLIMTVSTGDWTVPAAPANDSFYSPVDITGFGSDLARSTRGATLQASEYRVAGGTSELTTYSNRLEGGSVWYRWTAPSNCYIGVDTSGTDRGPSNDFDVVVCAFSGGSFGSMTLMGLNDRGRGLQGQLTNIMVKAGQTYKFAVFSKTPTNSLNPDFPYNTQSPSMNFRIYPETRPYPPRNDDFADAFTLPSSTDTSTNSSSKGATLESNEYTCAGTSSALNTTYRNKLDGGSVWYKWTAPSNCCVTLTTGGSDRGVSNTIDFVMCVFTGNTWGALSLIDHNARGRGLQGQLSNVVVKAGVQYKIAVYSKDPTTTWGDYPYNSQSANLRLNIWPGKPLPPHHDDFTSPSVVTGWPVHVTNDANWGATLAPDEYKIKFIKTTYSNEVNGGSVWYEWTSPVTGPVQIDTYGTRRGPGGELDMVMCVFTGNTFATLGLIDYSDRGWSKQGLLTNVSVRAGETYRIAIYAKTPTDTSNANYPYYTQSSNLCLNISYDYNQPARYTVTPDNGPHATSGHQVTVTNCMPPIGRGTDITRVQIDSYLCTIITQGWQSVTFTVPSISITGLHNVVISSRSFGTTTYTNAYRVNGNGGIGGMLADYSSWNDLGSVTDNSLFKGTAAGVAQSYNGKLYYFGGIHLERTGFDMLSTNAFRMTGIGTNWVPVAAPPVPLASFIIGTVGGSLYVAGGTSGDSEGQLGNDNTYRFNGTSWSLISARIPARSPSVIDTNRMGSPPAKQGYLYGSSNTIFAAASVTHNGELYSIGGTDLNYENGLLVYTSIVFYANGSTNRVGYNPGNYAITNMYKFDGVSWTELPGLPEPRMHGVAVSYSNAIYFIGGMESVYTYDSSPSAITHSKNSWSRKTKLVYPEKTVYRFDGTSWTEVASLPEPRIYHIAAVVGGRIHVYGGTDVHPNKTETLPENQMAYNGTRWETVFADVKSTPHPALTGTLGTNKHSILSASSRYAEHDGHIYNIGYQYDGEAGKNIDRYPAQKFSYGVAPSNSPYEGGVTVVIAGTNLAASVSDITSLTLCGVQVTNIFSASSTQIVVKAGHAFPGAQGLGNVRIDSIQYGTTIKNSSFTYGDPEPEPQTVTWNQSIPWQWTTNRVTLFGATASSGGPITYRVASGPAVITGGTNVTFTGSGSVTLQAYQAGDGTYWLPGSRNIAPFDVFKVLAPVSLTNLVQTANNTPRTVDATTVPEGMAVSLTYDGSPEGPIAAGSYAVTGTINNAMYHGSNTAVLVVNTGASTVVLSPLVQTYNGQPRTVNATTLEYGSTLHGGGIAVTYDGSGTAPVNAGSYTVVGTVTDPSLPGSATDTLIVNKANQLINFTLGNQMITSVVTLAASVPSGLPVSYEIVSGAATLDGSTLSFSGPGLVTVRASQDSGDINWNPAVPVERTIRVFLDASDITLYQLEQVYDGTERVVTNTTSPEGLSVILTYDGNLWAPTNAGSYTVTGTVDSLTYLGSIVATLTVAKAEAQITLLDLNQVYNGTERPASYTTEPTGLVVNLTYDGLIWAPTNAGSYAVTGTVEDVNYQGVTNGTLVVAKADQTIDFPAIADQLVTNLVELAATASTGYEVSFSVLSGPADLTDGTNLSFTASGLVSLVASQAGDANFNAAPEVTNTFMVNKLEAVLTLLDLNQIYDSTERVVGTDTDPAGLTVELTYDGSATAPVNAGTYTVTGTVNDVMYQAVTVETLVVAKADAPVTLFDLAQTYNGTARPVSAQTEPEGLTVDLTYDGNAWAPTNAGSYAVTGTVNDINYQGSVEGTLVVAKADQLITPPVIGDQWSTNRLGLAATATSGLPVTFAVQSGPAVITDGTNLSFTGTGRVELIALQLGDENWNGAPDALIIPFNVNSVSATVILGSLAQNYDGTPREASAMTLPFGLTVDLTYDGSATAPTAVGSYAVTGTVNDVLYQGSATGTLVVSPAVADVYLLNLAQTYDGLPKPITATSMPAGLVIEFTYDGSTNAPVHVGTYAVTGTVNDVNYIGSSSGELIVGKADQTITFPAIGNQLQTAQVGLSASAFSGLPVSFSVLSGPATLSGGTNLSFSGEGTVVIVASQGGNANWNAAPDVTNTFAIAQSFTKVLYLTDTNALDRIDPFATGDETTAQSAELWGEMALIGYTNNAADTTGLGAVGYPYRIGKYEVSISQFEASGAGNGNENYWNDGTRTVGTAAPAVNVSLYEAMKYCNWLTSGNTNNGAYVFSGPTNVTVDRASAITTYGTIYALPTEDEWYKAAYYTGNSGDLWSLYANGTDTVPTWGTASGWNYYSGGYLNSSPNYTWTVGYGGQDQNGTRNMMGNVWECIETLFHSGYSNWRGGSYMDSTVAIEAPPWPLGFPLAFEHHAFGFRLVMLGDGVTNASAANSSATFTQSPGFATAFSLKSNDVIVITNRIAVTSGTMPANPTITAALSYGGTNFVTMGNPTYDSGTSNLVWSGVMPEQVTIPAGEAITYTITSYQPGVAFRVLYDSASAPSQVRMATTSIIDVVELDVYGEAYPGTGAAITAGGVATNFVRTTVTDPFGQYDISRMVLSISGPGGSLSITNPAVVASNAASKTYEYTWVSPDVPGNYAVEVVADEGTEGITATRSLSMAIYRAGAVELHDLFQTYDGSARPVSATTTPAGLTATFTYNGNPWAPTNAGTYVVTGLLNEAWYSGSAVGTLTVAKAVAPVSLLNLSQTFNGFGRSASAVTVPSGLSVMLTYDGIPIPPVSVGSYAVTGTVNDVNYEGSSSGTLVVGRANQTINFPAIGNQSASNTIGLAATATSGLPVDFIVDSGPAVITDGTNLTFTGTGPVTITADQPGDADFNPAPWVQRSFTVNSANAIVNLGALLQTYDGTAREVLAQTEPEGLTVSLTYDGNAWAPTNAGSYAVTGTIVDARYQGSAAGTLVVARAPQTIAFPQIGNQLQSSLVGLSASAFSGLPVSFAVGSGPAAIAGGTNLSFSAEGTVSIVASQAGDANWLAAPNVTNTFAIAQSFTKVLYLSDPSQSLDRIDPAATGDGTVAQTIEFGAPGNAADPASGGLFGSVSYLYQIGHHEVTITEFARATGAGVGNKNVWSGAGTNAPVGAVSWYEAAFYCNWLTSGNISNGVYQFNSSRILTNLNRAAAIATYGTVYVLPTEDEWYKAAYFTTNVNDRWSLYAHGVDTTPTRGTGTTGWNYSFPTVSPVARSALFGTVEQNGTVNMMGNVYEWVESPTDLVLDDMTEARPFRGGAFDATGPLGIGSGARQGHIGPNEPGWTHIGFRVAMLGANVTNTVAGFTRINVGGTAATTSRVSFTQSLPFAQAFNLPSNAVIRISNFVSIVSGTMPANPNITASLGYGGTNFLTISNPVYTASAAGSNLVWSGVMPRHVTIPAGEALTYTIASYQPGVSFRVLYDSTNRPSQIRMATTNIIEVADLAVYSGAWPNSNTVSSAPGSSTLYVRSTVTDPFGQYDIHHLDLTIDGPGGSTAVSLSNAYVVATNAASKTYEYVWTSPVDPGDYAIGVTAYEGTEGITATRASSVHLSGALVYLDDLAQIYDGTAKHVTATTDPSGLTVLFTYDGSATEPVNAGSYAVQATVSHAVYHGATNGTLVISPADQAITFPAMADQITTNEVELSASSASGLPVSFTVLSGSAVITGGTTLTFTGAGPVSIVASQAGNGNWNAAPEVTNTFNVVKAVAPVTLFDLEQVYTATPCPVSASTDPSGLTVEFTYDGSATAPTAVGSYAVIAVINDAMYQGSAEGTLVIANGIGDIDLDNTVQVYDGTAKEVRAFPSPVGLIVELTYEGNPWAPTNAGVYEVVAAVDDYSDGFPIQCMTTGTLTIVKADQTIAFPQIPLQVISNTLELAATATSGFEVSFTVLSGPAVIADGTNLTFTGAGAVSIVASQAGDSNWNAAPEVTNTFNVSGKTLAEVSLNDLFQIYDGTERLVTAVTDPTGLTVNITYDGNLWAPTNVGAYVVTGLVNEALYDGIAVATLTVAKATAPVYLLDLAQVYDGDAKSVTATTMPAGLTVEFTYDGNGWAPTNPGSYAVTGTVVDVNYQGSTNGTLVIDRMTQTLDFPAIANQQAGTTLGLSATASSGLPVSFTVLSGSAVLTDGTNLTFGSIGAVTVVASQVGDTFWNPAAPVTNSITVIHASPVVGMVTLIRATNEVLKVPYTHLLANSTDPEGTALTVISVSALSTNGYPVRLQMPWVVYTPSPLEVSADDYFTFTVRTANGTTAPGLAKVIVPELPDSPNRANVVDISLDEEGNIKVRFAGIPGRAYEVHASEDIQGSGFGKIGNVLIESNGKGSFVDTNAPNMRFYRTPRK